MGWTPDASPHSGNLAAATSSVFSVPLNQNISLAPGRYSVSGWYQFLHLGPPNQLVVTVGGTQVFSTNSQIPTLTYKQFTAIYTLRAS